MYFIEMYSAHGQFEWFLREALDRGLIAGFVASSDDAFGKLGDSPPGGSGLFAVHGGLTCTYAERLDRDSLWQAFRARRVYGTTGERIQLRFRAGEAWQGEKIEVTDAVDFSVETSGTAPIEKVEIFRNLDLVHTMHGAEERHRNRLRILWRGASSKERARQSLWKGSITLSQGSFRHVLPYRLDQPNERIELSDRRSIEFDTVTSGDVDGVITELDGEAIAGRLQIVAQLQSRNQFGSVVSSDEIVELELPVSDIPATGLVKDFGGVDRAVEVTALANDYPDRLSFDWREPEYVPGRSAYWLKVTQIDGATAWSSPIFVERPQ
jgi:hypothetical protein